MFSFLQSSHYVRASAANLEQQEFIDSEINKLMNSRCRGLYLGSAVMLPVLSAFDLKAAPEFFHEFLGYRLIFSCLAVILYFLEIKAKSMRLRRMVFAFGVVSVSAIFGVMIHKTGGEASPYVPALTQIGLMVISFFPTPQGLWSVGFAFAFLATYIIPTVFLDSSLNPDRFGEEIIRMATFLTITTVWRLMSDRDLLNKLVLQFELKKANEAVQKKNQDLAHNIQLLRNTQNQLVETSKMAALGTVAAGVAHEVNNPLAIIQGYVGIMETLHSQGELGTQEFRSMTVRLRGAIQRISTIVGGLLIYSKKDRAAQEPLDVHQAIHDVLGIVRPLCEHAGIRINLSLNAQSMVTLGKRSRFEQTLVGLISNAKDALEKTTKEREILIRTHNEGSSLILSIQDNGEGIKPELIAKIFDPFFTTKEVGKGAGLGLTVARSLIDEMRGVIKVNSVEGLGTTFTIVLPNLSN